MDVHIELSTGDAVFARWDRLCLAVWKAKTTVSLMRRAGELLVHHASTSPDPLLLLTVIEANASLPALEARIEMVEFLKRANGKIERSALVIEGEGFRAASKRAVIAGVSLFSRPDYPHRVVASVGGAARFLVAGRWGSPAPHRIIRMVNEARRMPSTPFLPWLHGQPQPTDALPTR